MQRLAEEIRRGHVAGDPSTPLSNFQCAKLFTGDAKLGNYVVAGSRPSGIYYDTVKLFPYNPNDEESIDKAKRDAETLCAILNGDAPKVEVKPVPQPEVKPVSKPKKRKPKAVKTKTPKE